MGKGKPPFFPLIQPLFSGKMCTKKCRECCRTQTTTTRLVLTFSPPPSFPLLLLSLSFFLFPLTPCVYPNIMQTNIKSTQYSQLSIYLLVQSVFFVRDSCLVESLHFVQPHCAYLES